MIKNALFIFGICAVLFIFFLPSYLQMQDLYRKNADYEREVDRLTRKNKELLEERRRLRDDPDYLERVAREQFGIIKEGEEVYQIVPVNAN